MHINYGANPALNCDATLGSHKVLVVVVVHVSCVDLVTACYSIISSVTIATPMLLGQ